MGELDTTTDPDCVDNGMDLQCAAPVLDVAVDTVIAHPDYVTGDARRRHDIALVRLQHAVNFSDSVRPVCLPVAGVFTLPPPSDPRGAKVHGWGTQARNGA